MPYWTMETRKSVGGYDWTNTYHAIAADLEAVQNACLPLAAFERAILWNGATLNDIKVSPWPSPNSNQFYIHNVGANGTRAMSAPQPAGMCLQAKINTLQGRPGRKWYRMCLDEGDTTHDAGHAILQNERH